MPATLLPLNALASDTLHDAVSHATTSSNPMKPAIIFNVLPPDTGKSFLVLLIVMCLSLGAAVMEFFNHIRFDIQLIRKSGWSQPAKFVSRFAYLLCRYVPVVGLTLIILFLCLKLDNCRALPETFNILGMILFDSVSIIFVQRTMALYGWNKNVVAPLTVYYAVVLAAAAICIPFYGVGYRIPNTEFCAYDPRRHLTRVRVANVVYKSLSMGLDIILLLLTLHRLLDGGLKAVWSKEPTQIASSLSDRSLSSFLIRQGFHFYVLQLGSDLFFVSTYFALSEPSYQVMGTAFLFCVPPIAAAAAFRDMGKKASLITTKNSSKVNEIINSTNSASGYNSGVGGSGARGLSAVSPSNIAPCAVGVNTYVLQARSNHSAAPERTTHISWVGKRNFTHSRHDPEFDLGHNGILVTIGTVSRSEDVDEQWDAGYPRYSSDNPDPETLVMQKQWPKLAFKLEDGGAAAQNSIQRHISNPVQSPALAKSPTNGGHSNSYLSNLNKNSEQDSTPSSPWIPHTPESPYPPTMLHRKQFSRNVSTSSNVDQGNNPNRPRLHQTHVKKEKVDIP
ncbi:uncharacterized protein MEPE_01622 [Melanopsichium pennsylvanicum]|uniref:Uncharacterized protein n=2 Tax=Melanopsichium pennsylvanicum TaxID=63383 RepID=A0AAJ4XJL5_9BASI|nr:hypothetical protein BN887_03301 [Melanopsichium pennsylvanicum 4]SNX82916.1 uncharacterized protein MEPE_01622 [Melanopsichium pennsylvanicum]